MSHLTDRINTLLSEMSSCFNEYQYIEECCAGLEKSFDTEQELNKLEKTFIEYANSLYNLVLAFIEIQSMPHFLEKFKTDILYYYTNKSLFSADYSEDEEQVYSVLLAKYYKFLFAFEEFSLQDNKEEKIKGGIEILESILHSTSLILKRMGVEPKSESEVYKSVQFVCEVCFPKATFPTSSFQKTAKCYIPDILIPNLSCAIEYKYAMNYLTLIKTIDEILIDVQGYASNPSYNQFYAVFYVKKGIMTTQRFNEIWNEKQFPDNWKGIFVEEI